MSEQTPTQEAPTPEGVASQTFDISGINLAISTIRKEIRDLPEIVHKQVASYVFKGLFKSLELMPNTDEQPLAPPASEQPSQ